MDVRIPYRYNNCSVDLCARSQECPRSVSQELFAIEGASFSLELETRTGSREFGTRCPRFGADTMHTTETEAI